MSDIRKTFHAELKKTTASTKIIADDSQRAVEFIQNSLPGMSVQFSGSGAGSVYFDVMLNGQRIGTLNVDREFLSNSLWTA